MIVSLHLGVAKSGSTALQRCLGARRDDLRQAGIWLPAEPPFVEKQGQAVKHQPLVSLIRRDDPVAIDAWVDRLGEARPADCDIVLITAEGLWRQFGRHRPSLLHSLEALGDLGPSRGLLVTRPLAGLKSSLYKQHLRNRRSADGLPNWLTMVEWLAEPVVDALWDVGEYLDFVEGALRGPVTTLAYGEDAVSAAWDVITERRLGPLSAADAAARANRSLDDDAAELLRLLNMALTDLPGSAVVARRVLAGASVTVGDPDAQRLKKAIQRLDLSSVQAPSHGFQPTRDGVRRRAGEVLAVL
jgi:hypothetical protein